MIDRVLQIHLEPVARAHRKSQVLAALLRVWLVALGVGLVFVLARLTTNWISPWTFLLLSLGTFVATVIVAWKYSRRPLDFNLLAKKIEAENPRLHTLLLTAIEQKPDPATGELNYLQERVIREALAEDRRHQWRLDIARRLRFARAGSFVTLLLLSLVLLSLYQSAPPRAAFLALTGHSVEVTPGDATIEKGTGLVVLARFNGNVPTEATLVLRPANEPERRVPLVKNLEDPVFGASLAEITSELTYRIEYGSETTRDFRVTTFEYPRLERADAHVVFPAYTGLPEKKIEDTRRVSAVEGSTLDYTFHLNKPVKSATLVEVRNRVSNKSGGPAAEKKPSAGSYTLMTDTNRPNVAILNLQLANSGRYELLLVDDAGRTNKVPPLFVLEALTNRAPELKFAFPRGDQRVSALEEIAFQGEVSDDFGLQAYGFAYNLAGEQTQLVELGSAAGPHEKRALNQLVALESLGAKPDQLLSYYLWADDVGPDGAVRRSVSDMYFAEVRPFEEIFREGQQQDAGSAQQQQQGQQGQNAGERLAELQKQIITATWNLQRRERGTPSRAYKDDAGVVKESQQNALEQVEMQASNTDDPRLSGFIDAAREKMEEAVTHLETAVDANSLDALSPALAAEQSAYQALLRLAAREYQVSRGQNQGGGGGGASRAQRQINQMDLKQAENRYETERQAQQPQNPQQREQLQAFNRLKELAQRQEDVNERLKELQTALQEAKTEAEREELRKRLQRLQEEQRQMLADVDELQQRMERPENQSSMAEARQQLEQTRAEVQEASEAMERGDVSQALSSATRAQRDLQQLRDDFRKQNSSQFAEDMRELRSQAREIAQKQDEIGGKLDELNEPTERKSLTDAAERENLAEALEAQKRRMDELVKRATEVTQEAETVEPLLARQLYETLRQAAQNEARDIRETRDDLLGQGRLRVGVEERLRNARDGSQRAVQVASDLLRDGFASEAGELEERARRSINDLNAGVERAAQSVLGDDTEALRLARSELEELARQIEREIAQARQSQDTNATANARAAGRNAEREGEQSARSETSANQGERTGERSSEQQQAQADSPGSQPSPSENNQNAQNQAGQQSGQQDGEGQQPGNSPGQDEGQQELAANNQARQGGRPGGRNDSERASDEPANQRNNERQGGQGRSGGREAFYERYGVDDGGLTGGPITGPEFRQWSDRLRDVEEMLDVPELRSDVARIRDRAREARLELKRHAQEPQWDLVQMEIAGPLLELRDRVSEELARRESKDALVPIDRDPVPTRYSELVRRYYEELGKSGSPKPDDGGGKR